MYNRPAGGRRSQPYASGAGRANRTTVGDAAYTIKSWDRIVALTSILTANRTWTLPPAGSVPQGYQIIVSDEVGGADSAAFILVIGIAATDTLNGVSNTANLGFPFGKITFTSDGASNWSYDFREEGAFGSDVTINAPLVAGESVTVGTTLDVTEDVTIGEDLTVTGSILTANLRDSSTTFYDNADATKKLAFQLSSIATATTRTGTWPDASGVVVLEGATQTLSGKTLTSPTINSGSYSGNLVTSSGLIGYTAGAGGTVTQASSKTTAVTLDKSCGVITTNNAALAAATSVSFTVNNSTVTAQDNVVVNPRNANYTASVTGLATGSFVIVLTNITAGSLSDAVNINFAVINTVTT
jgi:hypothetical protein